MSKNKNTVVAITTIDNPFDPIDDFNNWIQFDMEKGYNTCGLLDRMSHTSDSFSDFENQREIERAIDDIIITDPLNIYKKVKH